MHLGRGAGADAGQQLQLVRRGVQHALDRGVPGLFEGPEAQPPVGDVLQPRQRDGGQLVACQLGTQRRQRPLDVVTGARVVGEQRARRGEKVFGLQQESPGLPAGGCRALPLAHVLASAAAVRVT